MSAAFSEVELKKASQGELRTLAELDRRGFIFGATESLAEFCERLKILQKNLNDLDRQLKEKSCFSVDDLSFPAEERIPPESFNPAGGITEKLYDFRISWVPGFFVTPKFGLLFGGCAYSFFPDFFSLFVIRNSFKKKKKWLVYERDELMSHELCHVARFALLSEKYEEQFAYQTSEGNFRRNYGCMMRSAAETYIIMAILIGMLVTQFSLFFFKREWMATRTFLTNPVTAFYLLLALVVGYLLVRQKKQNKDFSRILDLLGDVSEKPRALAFRLSDSEMDQIAKLSELNSNSLRKLLKEDGASSTRLEVLQKRFFKD
jgi:hypothetical protein